MQMERIKVLIADDAAQIREDIRRLLYFEKDIEVVAEAANGQETLEICKRIPVDVVLMDINMPVMDGITATEKISVFHPNIAVIIISIQGEQDYLKRSMMAGAREYLVKPFSSDELTNAIRKANEIEKKRRRESTFIGSRQMEEKKNQKKIFVVQSLKGGVGKSIIASNLAVALQLRNEGPVALVDLDLQGGDISVMLNLIPRVTIADIVQEKEIDFEVIKTALIHHSSGISVIPSPVRPEQGETIVGNDVEKILNILKEHFQYIVVDTPPYFHETNLAALDVADEILVVCSPDLPAIKNVRIGLETLENLDLKQKVKLILNRSNQDVGINPRDVEASLSIKIFAHIPSDGKIVIAAVNRGQPFVITNTGAKIAQTILALTNLLNLEKEAKSEKFSLFKKFLFTS